MVSINFGTIVLRRTWIIGAEIAKGGFGRIYVAHDEHGTQAVIKFIPKAPGALRELLFESLSDHPNIMPVVDSGEVGEYYVLVMPRAEKSLRQHLGESGGKLPAHESLDILSDVARALAGLQQDVVHRDVKPENILLYQGHWCLADFGIARYAEATTAPDTHKYAFSAPYAAPEQWRAEHATPSADIYALGVTSFELLQGYRPFPGPAISDYREQHLNQTPPSLAGCSPSIGALVTECLYKAPQARPTPAIILDRLHKRQQPLSPAAAQLAAANQSIVSEMARAGASASAQQSTEERRGHLFHTARLSLETILANLLERVRDAAPAASITRSPYLTVQLGNGKLSIASIQPAPPECLAAFGRSPAFDVIAYTAITVHQPRDRFNYEGRSHALWYCDAHHEGVYRWFETAFMIMPLIALISTVNPFALAPIDEKAAAAFSQTTSDRQIAWEPLPFDQGDEEQFIERWLGWFATATLGKLRIPSVMPENSGGHHRHPS